MEDPFTRYEKDLETLLKKLKEQDEESYNKALEYKKDLQENIGKARSKGNNDDLRNQREQILERLNEIAVAQTGKPFNRYLVLGNCDSVKGKKRHAITVDDKSSRISAKGRGLEFWISLDEKENYEPLHKEYTTDRDLYFLEARPNFWTKITQYKTKEYPFEVTVEPPSKDSLIGNSKFKYPSSAPIFSPFFWFRVILVVLVIILGVLGKEPLMNGLSALLPTPPTNTPTPTIPITPTIPSPSPPPGIAFWRYDDTGDLVLSTLGQNGQLENVSALNTPPGAVSPRLAPNGLVIAYIDPGGQDGRPPQIEAMGTEGDFYPTPLTNSPYEKHGLAWSPDGEWLAYTEEVTGCGVLMLMDYQERRSILITTPENGCVEHLAWAHHKNALLFDTIPPGQDVVTSTIQLATIDVETQEIGLSTWISDNAFAHPVWAPDDLAFAALSPGNGLHRMDINSGAEWQLVESTEVLSPTWPAGPTDQQYILYLSQGDVWRVPADGGGNGEQISPEDCRCVSYALSEDNTWLAYLKQEQEGDTSFSVGAVKIGSDTQAKVANIETEIPIIFWHTIDNPADE